MVKKLSSYFCSILILIGLVISYIYLDQERYILKQQTLPLNHEFYFDAPFEELNFLHTDGTTTNALFFKSKESKGVVLYLHGRGGNLATYWGYLYGDFTERGYDILMIDYRGFGKSVGIPSEEAFFEDAEVAYQYLLKEYPEDKITVYGISLGTGIATHLAATHSPRLLILEAPYYSMLDLIPRNALWLPSFIAKWIVRYPLRTDQWIEKVTVPVHLFHGREDALIPYHSSERLLEHIKSPHELTTIDKGTHNFLSRHPEFQLKLSELLP
ncbi:MAG: alpha/beta fold hydrolase [Simkaniaceae bacterium]|nr:alpha/beta fold hydrolase [Simkaniaceae bacterium]